MRKECAALLHRDMATNSAIRVITADLGFGILDSIRQSYPDRFYNVGAAEQLMIGVAIGMAEQGFIPICYSMSSFLIYRPFEFLRNYAQHEGVPIKLLGSGRDMDYNHDGITHWAHDDELVLAALPKIRIFKPKNLEELEVQWQEYIKLREPSYFNLRRML